MNRINLIIITGMIILTLSLPNYGQAGKDNFRIIEYSRKIGDGNELEKILLFEGARRKITQINISKGNSLGSHTADMPFLLMCVDGNGKLVLGKNNTKVKLHPGSMVTVESGVPHDIAAEPNLSILVVRFLSDLQEQ